MSALAAFLASACLIAVPVEASPAQREATPLPISQAQSLVFLGISGDYSADLELTVRDRMSEEFGLDVIGSPIRSLTDRDKRVWAIRTNDPTKLRRKLLRPFKKSGYTVVELHATVFSALGRVSSGDLTRSLRGLERSERKVWASHRDSRVGVVWVFHERKLKSQRILDALRKSGMKASFFHQEVQVVCAEPTDSAVLVSDAKATLDLVGTSDRDQCLVLDLYLRDVSRLLILDRGRHTLACPDVTRFVKKAGQAGQGIRVALENPGYPFVG